MSSLGCQVRSQLLQLVAGVQHGHQGHLALHHKKPLAIHPQTLLLPAGRAGSRVEAVLLLVLPYTPGHMPASRML